MQFHIGFDESHKERGKLGSNYRTLRQILEGEGFGCWEYSSFPITRQSLQNYDILVFACTDSSKYSAEEIEAVATWVKEDGGGLLLLSHAGGDRGRRTNMTELATQFGMIFENDQVLDDMNNYGIDNMPNIRAFPTPHPIVEGLTSICYRAGCSVSIVGMSQSIALTNPSSNPGNVTIIAAAEPGEGKAVCIGSYEIFRDEINGGISNPASHAQLAKNIFAWLVTPRRVMLREGGAVPASNPGGGTPPASSGSFDPYGVMKPQSGGPAADHGGKLVQITSIHDLFTEMQNIVKDIDVIRARVMNVFGVVSALDSGEGGGAAAPPAAAPAPAPAKKGAGAAGKKGEDVAAGPPPSKDDLLAMIAGMKGKKKEPEAGQRPEGAPAAPGGASMSNLLSELKSEAKKRDVNPDDLKALEVSQPGLGKVADDKEAAVIAPAPKEYEITSTDKRKSKADLEDEIDKLEAKIKSSENLKAFVDKQFKDGKKSEEDHQKEAGRLLSDIELAKSKVEAYKRLAASK
ncbi:MAG: hypothetical protein JW839_02880 [Candidatus Lokiarchaeota archaeon]|nr:hypothetical protein [Candidatus Lokiarchaeota archaeon]